ncbi:MAG: DUF5928 domain-containing protein [Paracoccaceae bacterium]
MARIAFILLCHRDAEAIVRQARQLTAAGDAIAIHFDASADRGAYERIRTALGKDPNVAFARRRVRCGWGEWSLVEGTLLALEAALEAFGDATHFYMVSGDCMAIKSAAHAHRFLDERDVDHIESVDFFDGGWIKTGMREERLIYRHLLNERKTKWLFYAALEVQRRLGLKRAIPEGIRMMIGSQWWCLRRSTVEAIMTFRARRADVMRFFATTWIPDETFFQTLVRHLVPRAQIVSRTPTFLMFSDYGMPVNFYDDHYDLLLGQDALFARKISPGADQLRERLGSLWASGRDDFAITGEGRQLYHFLSNRGRHGRRFAPRFWETESTLGRERSLLIVTCKKWHVAKRLTQALRAQTDIPALDFIFSELDAGLPDLGGIQSSLDKRTRHRRALMRMLYDHHGSDRLAICLDPSNLELMADFYGDRSATRMLEIEVDLGEGFLRGHAIRTGLVGERTSEDTWAQVLPTLRDSVVGESVRIRDREWPDHYHLSTGAARDENLRALTRFLQAGDDTARAILDTPGLLDD